MQVTNKEVNEQLGDGNERSDHVISVILDAGVNGKKPLATGLVGKAVGFCRAIVNGANERALHWTWTKEKIWCVMHVAFRRVREKLLAGGPGARELLAALSEVFPSGPNQFALDGMFTQLGGMINDWSSSRGKGDERWMTIWRPLTEIIEGAVRDLFARLPSEEDLLALLHTREALDTMSVEAQRVHQLLTRDINDGRFRLYTSLSQPFLVAQTRTLRVDFINHIDAEHGFDLRALNRVLVEKVAVEPITVDGQILCVAQVLPRKVIKELVADHATDYFDPGDVGNGLGRVWRPKDDRQHDGEGLGLFGTGFFPERRRRSVFAEACSSWKRRERGRAVSGAGVCCCPVVDHERLRGDSCLFSGAV